MCKTSEIEHIKRELSEIDFYKRFPVMIPFIGDFYISTNHRKLLLVGESFYLPNSSTIHLDAKEWYNSNLDKLSEKESEWINCEGLLISASHTLYKELNKSIGESKHQPFIKRPLDEIAFTNFFVRPAKEGKSIKDYKKVDKEKDKEKANELLKCVLNVLKPEVVIFVSKFAYESVDKLMLNNCANMYADYVVHPCSPYWNCGDCKKNRKYFLKLLNDFINH